MAQKKSPQPQVRLSSAERRQMIILKAGILFAKKGFHGVTTKELAKACKVSEPVIYQHFDSKEDIYNELNSLCKGTTTFAKRALSKRQRSTETLCFFAYLITSIIALYRLPGETERPEDAQNIIRLMGFSFLEDGRFVKVVLRDCIGSLFDDWKELYKVAHRNGDLEVKSIDEKELWIAYELMVGAGIFHLTGPHRLPALHGDEEDFLERVSLFTLRGLGLKESALKAHFKPKAWTAEVLKLLGS